MTWKNWQQPQGQYWASRAPPPNNSNYQYGRC